MEFILETNTQTVCSHDIRDLLVKIWRPHGISHPAKSRLILSEALGTFRDSQSASLDPKGGSFFIRNSRAVAKHGKSQPTDSVSS